MRIARFLPALLTAAAFLAPAVNSASASAATNLLQNPSLESASSGVPTCWKLGGYGTNTYRWTYTTDAHSGSHAENLQLTSVTSGDRKLISAEDGGTCAPAATPGDTYTVGAWYKVPSGSTGTPKFYAYYRTSLGTWTYWAMSRTFSSSSSWTYVTWTTPAFPSGATNISVGMGLTSVGSVTMDDFSLAQNGVADSTPPTAPSNLSATAGDGQVALSWNASTDPDSPVAGYYVFRNGSKVAQVTGTSYTNTGLTDGTSYSYYVEAYDPSGNTSPPSSTVSATPTSGSATCPSPGAQTTWAPVGRLPMSDAQAAACVVHQPENRPGNVQYNNNVPTNAQLLAFHSAPQEHAPLTNYVTGRPGLTNPSTDDLIQWVAHKWGIPEDWIRADMVVESWWRQTSLGNRRTVSSAWYALYPLQAQIAGTSDVYQSMGISQVRWSPAPGDFAVGTEPLRWQSTAFALDFYAAVLRWYYDGDCSWCGSGYSAGQQWNSIGAWYQPYPWGNSGQASYITKVQSDLQNRVWAQSGF